MLDVSSVAPERTQTATGAETPARYHFGGFGIRQRVWLLANRIGADAPRKILLYEKRRWGSRASSPCRYPSDSRRLRTVQGPRQLTFYLHSCVELLPGSLLGGCYLLNMSDEHIKPFRAENNACALSIEPLAICGSASLSKVERYLSFACKLPSVHTVHYCEPRSSESFRSSNPA
jgi:hypothetical protein